MKRWTDAERRRPRDHRVVHQSVRAIATLHVPTIPPPGTLVDAFLRKPSGTALPNIAVPRAPLAGRPGRRAPRTRWPDEYRTKIQILIDAGHTNAEIAGELGCTITTLAAWLHKHGVRRATGARARGRAASALKKQRSGARGPVAA